jgi:hypothetical protein
MRVFNFNSIFLLMNQMRVDFLLSGEGDSHRTLLLRSYADELLVDLWKSFLQKAHIPTLKENNWATKTIHAPQMK